MNIHMEVGWWSYLGVKFMLTREQGKPVGSGLMSRDQALVCMCVCMCMFVVELGGGIYKAAAPLGEAYSALVGGKWIHL